MATYTIEINENTHSERALIVYLKELGILVEKIVPKKKSSYECSQENVRYGRVESFSSSEEMFQSLGIWCFMYKVKMTKTFRKNTELCIKLGYDMELLKHAVRLLEAGGKLTANYLLTSNTACCVGWLLFRIHRLTQQELKQRLWFSFARSNKT